MIRLALHNFATTLVLFAVVNGAMARLIEVLQ